MEKKIWVSVLIALLIAIVGCSGGGGDSASISGNAQLMAISVTPANASIAMNTGEQFIATGIYSDNSKKDLTSLVEWTSSDSSIATVNSTTGTSSSSGGLNAALGVSGYVQAKNTGTVTIKASWGKIYGSAKLEIKQKTLVSVAITPPNPSIVKGTGEQFTAVGTFSDNTTQDLTGTVVWASSNAGVATISDTAGSMGLAASLAAGSTTISATAGGVSGSTTLTVTSASLVSIEVTPTNPSVPAGTVRQLAATGRFSDNTTQDLTTSVNWSSNNTSVATISSTAGSAGLATTLAAGSTTITASSGGLSGSTTLTVSPAALVSIAITPSNPAIVKGTAQQFTATGTYTDGSTHNLTTSVSWMSSNTAVATISNAAGSSGIAASVAAGSTTISAASGSISASATLTVTQASLVSITIAPSSAAIAKGTKQQFSANGTFSDGTTQTLTAAVTWSSSNTLVATISNAAGSNGLATSVAAGTTTIRAVSGSVSGSATLTVNPATLISLAITPANSNVSVGGTRLLTATGTYSDSSTQNLTAGVTWSSSNTAVATVSNAAGSNGLATGVAAGSTTIGAISGSVSASTSLSVFSGTAMLAWDPDTMNTDGSPLVDLAGYKIYYGTSSGIYSATINAGNVTTYALNNLAPGTYYFAVTAINTSGAESDFSNEVMKTIQ